MRASALDYAARIIQKGCHNWLYAPVCKDETIGIVPRLGIKAMKVEGLIEYTAEDYINDLLASY